VILNKRDVEVKIREIIDKNCELTKRIQEIRIDDELQNYGMDSLSVIRVIVEIEEDFEFEFNDEDLVIDNFKSVDKLVDYVLSKKNI
jgi:acyl carrier protein